MNILSWHLHYREALRSAIRAVFVEQKSWFSKHPARRLEWRWRCLTFEARFERQHGVNLQSHKHSRDTWVPFAASAVEMGPAISTMAAHRLAESETCLTRTFCPSSSRLLRPNLHFLLCFLICSKNMHVRPAAHPTWINCKDLWCVLGGPERREINRMSYYFEWLTVDHYFFVFLPFEIVIAGDRCGKITVN